MSIRRYNALQLLLWLAAAAGIALLEFLVGRFESGWFYQFEGSQPALLLLYLLRTFAAVLPCAALSQGLRRLKARRDAEDSVR